MFSDLEDYPDLIPELNNYATEAQKNYIKVIEEFAPEDFIGVSKKEASNYIDRFKDCVPKEGSQNMWSIINGY